METTRLSSKGQIVLPKNIRDKHSWAPGQELTIEEVPGGVVLRSSTVFPRTTIDQVIGCLGKPKKRKRLTEANIEAAIKEAVMERYARSRH